VKFKVVYSRLLSVTRLSRPMTMATTAAAMMTANIGVLSGAASGAAGSGGAAVTHRAVCADDVQ
jgi:hypothetical protein